MRAIILLLTLLINFQCQAQNADKAQFLKNHRFDLTMDVSFPQKNFKIIGFGAYHGSAKTEETEIALLKSLIRDTDITYYLPETDFSIAHYFNEFLQTGDTLLLKDLVTNYGTRVPQDQSIETYNKWKTLKKLNDTLPQQKKLQVVGIDYLVNYKYTAKHLLKTIAITPTSKNSLQEIAKMVALDTTDFSPYYESYAKKVFKSFITDYEENTGDFTPFIQNTYDFNHIIANIKRTFVTPLDREAIIFENYKALRKRYNFDTKSQFLRFGFFHIEKESEGNATPFFARLIKNKIYKREEIISIIGYLTESRVLWEQVYDENGNYKSFTTEGGYGIGDYEKEYFLGIENLKKTKLSDITLYQLNTKNTPYAKGVPDLIEIVMTDAPSNHELVKGKSTTDYLDYAVLISNSKASTPIQEQ